MTTSQTPPGSTPRPPELTARLDAALAAMSPQHRFRTRHFDGHEHAHTGEYADPYAPPGARPDFSNRLLLEASPYLRQHAHNPVDWWPWGQAAFEEARRRNCPIFLSIGYSTCHWCHVMEHESFEDLEVARLLNERYVAVKVDREERPDVDAVYMTALQATQGGGGWPMSVWLAPGDSGVQGLPYFAGTYFPPRAGIRGQRLGFLEILKQLADLYVHDPARVLAHGQEVAAAVRQHLGAENQADLQDKVVGTEATDRVVGELARSFDDVHGGRRVQPKFPSQTPVQLLLRHWQRTGEAASLHMAAFTLRKMAAGGIYDHVGGGWHRYSTDGRWFAPHFEKMLYDQGLITLAALDCLRATGEAGLEDVIRGTLDYLVREMQHDHGGFFSATDADSEGREGLFFLWTLEQLRGVLGEADARLVAGVYGATPEGNFEDSNILHRAHDWPELAQAHGITEEALRKALRGPLDRLYQARLARIPPLRDDKVQASWNGLVISALARAGQQLREPAYVQAAEQAADFVLERMRPAGRLVHAWLDGQCGTAGFLDDHAFLVQGLLDLLEASGDARWLRHALEVQQAQDEHFGHPHGGWFTTAADAETLLARARPDHDGAEPSGNSVGARNLVRLAVLTGEDRFRVQAEATVRAFGDKLRTFPAGLSEMLLAVEALHVSWREVVLVAAEGKASELDGFLRAIEALPAYHTSVLAVTEGPQQDALARLVPSLRERTSRGSVTAYVCQHGTCGLPVSDVAGLADQLR